MASSGPEKRPASNSISGQLVKRQKSDVDMALANRSGRTGALTQVGARTSGLQHPNIELAGHSGEVFAARFDPTGQLIASGSMDRTILLWKTYGNNENYGILSGHKSAVLDLQWSRDANTLYSASADMTLASWDLDTGKRIRRHEGHEEVINSMDVSKRGQEMLVSGSDDGSIGVWDPRKKHAVEVIQTDFPITAVALSEAGNELYTGGIDNDVKVWDLRKQSVMYTLPGHTDVITSLAVSPDSQTLLSNSHDNSVRTWDIRPFAPANRHIRTFDGAARGIDPNLYKASWSSDGKTIAAADGQSMTVVCWDALSGKMLYKMPGHKGAVNDVRFSPIEPIILSASTDRTLMLGELSSR